MSMKTHMMRPTALALAMSLIAASLPVQAQQQGQQPNRRQPAVKPSTPVTLNFVNTDIEAVSRAMSAAMGKPILVDPRVKGTMTLTAEQPVPVQEAYLSYLAALRGLGFAMVDAGGILKLVPEAEAKLQTGSVSVGGESRQRGDQIVTQIFKLNHENANNLVAVLRPLITPNNTINANPGNNSLVITDYAENLQRISRIVAALDQPSNTDIEVIPLRNAVASDVVQLVQRLSEGGGVAGQPGGGVSAGGNSVLADPRSNALIVRASNPARLMQLRAMIAKLDTPGIDAANGNIRVIYLKNADAVRLATVLRAAFSANSAATGGSGGSGGGNATVGGLATGGGGGGSGGAVGNTSFSGGNSSFGGGGGSSSGSSSSSGVGSSTQVSATAQPNTGGFVQADPATNSLIITAPEPMYKQIRAVVEQLDTRRAQVYIEALVVKVDASKVGQFGVQWQNLFGSVGIGTNFGTGYSNILNLSAAAVGGVPTSGSTGGVNIGTALTSGNIPQGLNIGATTRIGSYLTLGAVANALEQLSGTNVLSTPSLVVQDNEEADMIVGRNVPVISSTTQGNSITSPFNTYERRDVGLRLKIKTQVGENGTVRIKVYQENSSVVDGTGSSATGPTIDKSAVETSVTLEDGQALVLSGMLKDEYSDGENKVPGLGDIPLLGNLFKNQSRNRTKSNLMIFLRPVVLRTPESANAVTLDRYDAIRAYQQDVQPARTLVLPNTGAPMLPERPLSSPALPTPPRPASEPASEPTR